MQKANEFIVREMQSKSIHKERYIERLEMEEKGDGEENGEGEKRYRENRKRGMDILLVSLGHVS